MVFTEKTKKLFYFEIFLFLRGKNRKPQKLVISFPEGFGHQNIFD